MQILRYAQNNMAQSVVRSCFEIRPPTDTKRDVPVPMVVIGMRHPRKISQPAGNARSAVVDAYDYSSEKLED